MHIRIGFEGQSSYDNDMTNTVIYQSHLRERF